MVFEACQDEKIPYLQGCSIYKASFEPSSGCFDYASAFASPPETQLAKAGCLCFPRPEESGEDWGEQLLRDPVMCHQHVPQSVDAAGTEEVQQRPTPVGQSPAHPWG